MAARGRGARGCQAWSVRTREATRRAGLDGHARRARPGGRDRSPPARSHVPDRHAPMDMRPARYREVGGGVEALDGWEMPEPRDGVRGGFRVSSNAAAA